MTLSEMAAALDVPPRQIRFMIAEGFVPPASTTGRGADAYGDLHLAKARRYMTMHGMGMKPSAIRVLMAFDDALPIFQGPGVELRVDPALDPARLDVAETVRQLEKALRAYATTQPAWKASQ